ncbi:MAG TPA: hypothetical protein VNL15_03800 [Dehalococcoidia bacterium]|nr:hypothetical protein [Dehalococcoidia bacterium]
MADIQKEAAPSPLVAFIASATASPLLRQMPWWVLILPAVMIVALVRHSTFLLNYVHVLAGVLWTGADLFLGFIIGPVMRRLEPLQRRAVITYLVPRTLLFFPVVALVTSTAGWYLADWQGFMEEGHPRRPWVLAALGIVSVLTVQGLGIILPNTVRIYRELQRPEPDVTRIWRLQRINLSLAGLQGAMQVAIIFVMAHLVKG